MPVMTPEVGFVPVSTIGSADCLTPLTDFGR